MAKKEEKETQETKAGQEAKATQDSKSAQSESSGFNVSEFFKGTKEELDKVVWPDRRQLVSESVAVILMVTLSATVIYLVDNLFSWGSSYFFG